MRRTIALSMLLMLAAATNMFAAAEARMAGKVIDAATKAPIAGAKIDVMSSKSAGKTVKQSATTGKDGTYAIFLLDGTIKYDFTITAEGYAPAKIDELKLAIGQTTTRDIELSKPAAATPVAAPAAPDPAVVAYNAGAALANEGKVDEAIAKIEEAMKLRADLPAGPGALARLYIRTKNYPKAIENAQKALALDADDTDMNAILFEAYNATGDKAKAAEYKTKMPANPAVLFNDAAKEINAQHDDKAEPLLKQAIAADEKFARAYYELGMLYVRAGKNADAKTNLQKYLDLEPNGKDATTAKEMLNYVK